MSEIGARRQAGWASTASESTSAPAERSKDT